MATSVNLGYCLWLTGGDYTESLLNQYLGAWFYNDQSTTNHPLTGALPSGDLQVSASSGMTISVNAGSAVCPVTGSSTSGGYLVTMTGANNLTVSTADPANPRIDIVCITVSDVGSSSSFTELQIVAGTPSGSPSAPATPSNSLLLAQIAVAAGATSITSGNITDKRVYTVCQGGIMPVAAASAPLGYPGAYIHDLTSGALKQNTASGVVQAHTLPYAPVQAFGSGSPSTSTSGGNVIAASLTFTTDGNTDWELYGTWPGLWSTASNAFYAAVRLYIDSAIVAEILVRNDAIDSTGAGGGCLSYFTTSSTNRPSAGSHTMTLRFVPTFTGSATISMNLTSTRVAYVRARPVTL